MAKSLLLLALALVGLAGCSSETDLSKNDEAKLKNNFTRSLTPDELGQMGKSKESRPPSDKL